MRCAYIDSDHQVLLYHTQVRWLSKGYVTQSLWS